MAKLKKVGHSGQKHTLYVSRFDLKLFGLVARHHNPPLDYLLPRLSVAANHSTLWFLISALLAAFGQKETARRGLVSLAIASLVANLFLKPIFRRRRPLLKEVPKPRQLHKAPISTSFPSGHSASAFAFAIAVGSEIDALKLPLWALASLVAFSRVYVGVHYPTDVIAGVSLGSLSAKLVTNQAECFKSSSGNIR